MEIAFFAVTLIICVLLAAVGLFLVFLVARQTGQRIRYRQMEEARHRYEPLVQRVLNGEFPPDARPLAHPPGSPAWEAVEQMLRHALAHGPRGQVRNIERFFRSAGYTSHALHQLAHGDRWQRAVAAMRLIGQRSPRVIHALLEAARDREPDVRLAAIEALGVSRDREAMPVLADLLEDVATRREPLSRRVVSGVLTRFGPEVADVLVPLLSHDAWRVRGAAVYVLGEVGAVAQRSAVMERLADREPDVRAKAARALGKMAAENALFPLLGLLEDPAWLVRMQALRALGGIGDDSVSVAVARRLNDASWRVRQEAAATLSRLGPGAMEYLSRTVMTATDRYAREQVVEELQRTPLLRDAIGHLADAGGKARNEAVALLRAVGEAGAVSPHLNAMKNHPDPGVRQALVDLVDGLCDGRIPPVLSSLAENDSDPSVRAHAADQLRRMAAGDEAT